MTFEIQKKEGLGRLGTISMAKNFETPTFLNIRLREKPKIITELEELMLPHQSNELQQTLSQANLLDYDNDNSQTFTKNDYPTCFLYPHLQIQGKSINKISHIQDFFPREFHNSLKKLDAYHFIPWDLPSIFLDNINEYIQVIQNLNQQETINRNLMINIPFSPDLERNLDDFTSLGIGIVSLGDISSLLNHPEYLIKYITVTKQKFSPDVILYAPSVPSFYFPILSYLGIDLFDFTFLTTISTTGENQTPVIFEHGNTHSDYIYTLNRVRRALKINKLRDLARVYANSYPPQKTLLKKIDQKHSLEQQTSLYGAETLYCTDDTDLTRPEVSLFRERVANRFSVPSYTRGIIFLPCSARKPYSQSKSHASFRHVIKRSLKSARHSVMEIILTSPLGVVPRDLEYTFPAAHYDIPVTGDWSNVERNHLAQDLRQLLSKCSDSTILIGYVKGAEREVLKAVCLEQNRKIHLIGEDITSLTSKEGLFQLNLLLKEKLLALPRLKVNNQLEFLRTVCDYQFGQGTGNKLIPDTVQIRGRKEIGLRVTLNGKHLLTFRKSTGLLTLSLEAARLLFGHSENIVKFDGDHIQGSTIFANAIKEAHSEIRINDEVIIVNNENEIIATGVAYLPGNLLVSMKHGFGIKIRQKVK